MGGSLKWRIKRSMVKGREVKTVFEGRNTTGGVLNIYMESPPVPTDKQRRHSYFIVWNTTLKIFAPHPAVDGAEYVAGVGVPDECPVDGRLLSDGAVARWGGFYCAT